VRLFERAALSVLALAVIGLPTGIPGAAVASSTTSGSASTGATAASVPCVTDLAARFAGSERAVPKWRNYSDTSPVTAKDLAALPAEDTRRAVVNREVRPSLAKLVYLPVYAHVIRGTHKGERNVTSKRVRGVIRTLNLGMRGKQSSLGTPLRYRFVLNKIDYTKNDGWYHASLFGPRDRAAKRHLHRGGSRSLNLYINGGGSKNSPVLGWARFPWQYQSTPALDSVSINVAGMRGGSAAGYNLNDTVIHETGHWLGLYHTFQGGCGEDGDLVGDTPAEAEPSFGCNAQRDTCASDPGNDPVRDFMDYSLDACMNRFTAGQAARIDTAFARWRR
jgi:hypothetical protein